VRQKPSKTPIDPTSKKATVEEVEDEDGPAKKKKPKKKKKKTKKKKAGTSADADQADGEDDEDEHENENENDEVAPLPSKPTPGPAAAPASPVGKGKKPEPKTTTKPAPAAGSGASPYAGPSFPSTASIQTQSGHSYVKSEGLTDVLSKKFKTRPTEAPTAPAGKEKDKKKDEGEKKPGMFERARMIVSKRTKAVVDKLVKHGDDPSQWKGSMKWDAFVKVCFPPTLGIPIMTTE
jgi:hypothetical protein